MGVGLCREKTMIFISLSNQTGYSQKNMPKMLTSSNLNACKFPKSQFSLDISKFQLTD